MKLIRLFKQLRQAEMKQMRYQYYTPWWMVCLLLACDAIAVHIVFF